MKMTETINEDIAEFEKATGKVVSPKLRELIEALAIAGDYFENLGERDASHGRQRRTKSAFIKWGEKEFPGQDCANNPIVDLMYECYSDGYNARSSSEA